MITALRLLISIVVVAAIGWFLWFLNTPEVRYRSYPAHYKLVNGYNGPGDIISSGSSRSQTSISSDILSERFACGLEKDVPVGHDISRSMPGLGIQYVMLRDAFESREKDGVEPYKYALVEYKETNTTFKYHPFMYQVGTFADLYESHVTSNLDVNYLTRLQLFLQEFFKKNVNTLGLLIGPQSAALKPPANKLHDSNVPELNVDLTESQLINSEGLSQYDNAQGKSWKSLPDRRWEIDADYERRALYYARKIKKLGDKYNTKIIFHSIPVYYQPAQDDFVRAQFEVGVGEPLYTPHKAWLDEFYQSGPFGDGGHMNRKGSSAYISWLAKEVFPDCKVDIAETEAMFIETGKTAGQRFLENFKADQSIPEHVPIPNELGFDNLTEDERQGKPKATLRPLPYPYNRYLTIASDVDSQTWRTGRLIHEYLHDQLGLPLSDSIFISHGAAVRKKNPDVMAMTVKYADTNQLVDLIEWYDRGWFDTIHGWGNHNFLSTRTNLIPSFENGKAQETYKLSGESLLTAGALTYPSGNEITPHVLSFGYLVSDKTRFTVSILDGSRNAIWTSPKIDTPATSLVSAKYIVPEDIVVNLFKEISNTEVFVQVNASADTSDPLVKISNISLSSRNPISVKYDIDNLEKYNLNFPVFTTHGGAIAGLFGVEDIAAMGLQNERAKIQLNVQGDKPDSDFYWMDQLDDYNLRYILPANRTALNNDVRNISNQTIHFTYRDKIKRYSFQRSIALNSAKIASLGNMSYTNAIGHNVNLIVQNADKQQTGYGAVFYTHWGLLQNSPKPETIKDHFNPETLAAFENLQKLYYASDKDSNRYWVAPLIDTLQYSRALQAMKKRATYDSKAHRIDIYSATDPILGTPFPNASRPLIDLAHVTFIVEDAMKTRIFLDGQEISSLQRNSADSRGRESVTIVNDHVFKPILRKVDFVDQNGKLEGYGCQSRAGKSQNFSVLEITPVAQEGCEIVWSPAELNNRDSTHLIFRVKAKNDVSVSPSYTLKSGETFAFKPSLGPVDSSGWMTAIIELNQIGRSAFERGEKPTFGQLGRGDIENFKLEIESLGNVGIKDIGFIRQNGLPVHSEDYVVAGRIKGETAILEGAVVQARNSEGKAVFETSVSGNSFIFDDKVKNGTRLTFNLRLPSGKIFEPTGNAVHVIEKNTVGINFDIN